MTEPFNAGKPTAPCPLLTSKSETLCAGCRTACAVGKKNMQTKPFVNPHQFTPAQRRAGLRTLILKHLRQIGGRGTAREVAKSIGKPLKNIWPRFTELAAWGSIRDTGLRVHGKGRASVIWADAETTQPVNDKIACEETLPVLIKPDADCRQAAPDWFNRFGC